MKLFRLFFILIFVLQLYACNSSKFVVESDYSYNSDFRRYKNFSVVSRIHDNKDSSMYNTSIAREIYDRMKIQGYKSVEKRPNLLVFYKIYNEDFNFQGFNQPQMEEFIKENTNKEEEEKYNPQKYRLQQGSLLIQLIDSKSHSVVWQGYTSGLFSESNTKNERVYRRAVRSIFDQYRAFAEGYIMKANTVSEITK